MLLNNKHYYNLPPQERKNLWKHYKKVYPNMGYTDMVKHFNGEVENYQMGGETTSSPDVTEAKDYMKDWYNSPMYKNIYQSQLKDLGMSNPKRIERVTNRAVNLANQSNFNVNPTVVKDLGKYGEGSYDNKGARIIKLDKNFVENNPKLVNSLYTHELAHDNLMTAKDEEYISKNTPKFNSNLYNEQQYSALTNPEEVRSQIHSIRQLGKKNKIYDPLTQPFKKEYLDKINESYKQGTKESEDYNQVQRLRKFYSDDQITDMLNKVTKTKSTDQSVYAKHGGIIKTHQFGGRTDYFNSDVKKFANGGKDDGNWLETLKTNLNPYNWGVEDYSKYKTRGQAFNAARKAGEKEFMWNNKRYNTRKDTDPIPYIGSNPNQQEYDNFLRKNYSEFFKTLNRGKNVSSITWEGVSDKEPNRAHINAKKTNSNINVGKNPETGHEFISNLIAESSHLKDPKLYRSILNPYDWKSAYEHIKYGDPGKYNVPGTSEYNAHRLREPGMAMIAYGNLSPDNIKKIQKHLGVKNDGYFGPDTYKAMQFKYANNPNIKTALFEHKLRYKDDDKNPISFGDDINLVRAYLQEIESEVPFKNNGRLANKLTANKDYTDNALNSIIPGSGDYNVNKLQTTLVNKGYQLPKSTTKSGNLDGIFGDETKVALEDWQKKNRVKNNNVKKKMED